MSENNYGALMMKSTVGVSDDINAILSPGIYPIPPANTSSPDSAGGILIIRPGESICRNFISDSTIYLTSTRKGNAWTPWKGPLARTEPFADIKADGAAAVAEALSNLGLGAAAKKDVGTGTGQIPDMSSFVFTGQDLGSFKLPGGFIVQWAYLTSLDPTGWTLVNFQNAWPTKILGAMAINEAGTVLADKIMGAKRLTDTQLQITCVFRSSGAAAQGGAYVIAWGK